MSGKVLGNLAKGLLFVVSAPAGTGKTTLVRMLMDEFDSVQESVSFTTRAARPGEEEGVHYHFVDDAEFELRRACGEFIESVRLFGNSYGTSLKHIQSVQEQGKHVVLVIDTEGAMQLKDKLVATFIFISPPSTEALRERLLERKTESDEVVDIRLARALEEMSFRSRYDYHIVNENLLVAYDALRSVLIAEEHHARHLLN